jgi:integrase
MTNVTFVEQSKWFLEQSVNRKRNPVKPATAMVWKYTLSKHLVPFFGSQPLATVTNASVRSLVERFYKAGLSPQSIVTYVNLVKLIVASAIDENGEEVYPRKWNSSFIDMPIVANQRRPSFTAEAMSSIVLKAEGPMKVLYALLAGSGLRIGEALGLEVKHVSACGRVLNIEQSAWQTGIQTPKTTNAFRQVDLTPELAMMVRTQIGGKMSGLVFPNSQGNPLSQTNLLRRYFHPLLKGLGIPKQGFHGTRRFRATWLRKQMAPEDLIHFWLGHAPNSITDIYSKLSEDVEFRQEVTQRVGLGFSLSA